MPFCRNFTWLRCFWLFAFLALFSRNLHAQATTPDVLILTDDERVSGKLISSSDSSVTFQSDILGKLTIGWDKVKELHTSGTFAVIPKHVKLKKGEIPNSIQRGSVDVAGQNLEIEPQPGAAAATVPIQNTAHIVSEKEFEDALLHSPGIFGAWKGSLTAGASLVQATQNSRTLTTAITLSRPVPTQDWMQPSNRTDVNFNSSYGKVSTPGQTTIKTAIYHADAQRDQYFTGSLFAFGQAAFDHNFSQGLDLEQTYGAGIGWTVIKNPDETLDLKGDLSYSRQTFQVPDQDLNLFGSRFSQDYNRKFPRNFTLSEQLAVAPSWNQTRAYSANAIVLFTIPVYKQFGFSVGLIDTFLNNPPAGFRKNSFQFTTGLTYTLP